MCLLFLCDLYVPFLLYCYVCWCAFVVKDYLLTYLLTYLEAGTRYLERWNSLCRGRRPVSRDTLNVCDVQMVSMTRIGSETYSWQWLVQRVTIDWSTCWHLVPHPQRSQNLLRSQAIKACSAILLLQQGARCTGIHCSLYCGVAATSWTLWIWHTVGRDVGWSSCSWSAWWQSST